MRLYVRKFFQIILLFAIFTFINVLYLRNGVNFADSDTVQSFGQLSQVQDGDNSLPVDSRDKRSNDNFGEKINHRVKRDNSAIINALDKKDEQHVKTVRQLKNASNKNDYNNQGNEDDHEIELQDIFLSIKTTEKFHSTRLELLLQTWIVMAREQTYIFTDADDEDYRRKTNGHMINTNCSTGHSRAALCCKMSAEYDAFIESNKRWWCHVDDDTYVNVPALLRLLRQYDSRQDWYLGKPSLNHPIEARNLDTGQKEAFWFATGGAGFCISRAMALKMLAHTGGGKIKTVCNKIRLPDDCTIGYIIYTQLQKKLTVVDSFHSHLEGLWRVRDLETQLTFSYSQFANAKQNLVNVQGFDKDQDPTRFWSIHCHLYPYLKQCASYSTTVHSSQYVNT